jgi:hypothetical protein
MKFTLMVTELHWCKAIERNDVDEIATFMAEEWRIIGSDGIAEESRSVFMSGLSPSLQ